MLKAAVALALIGAAIYLLVRVVQHGRTGARPTPRLPRRFGRQTAPDDDPGFLRELDEQVWREKRQRQRAAAADGPHPAEPVEPTTTAVPPGPPAATVDPGVEPDPAGDEAPGSPTSN